MNIFIRRWPQSQGETAAADGKTRAQPFPIQRLARAPANHAGARPADQVAGQTNEFLHLIRGTPRPPTARSVESRPKGILPQALSGAVCATSTRLRDSKRAKASRSLAALSHIVLVAIVTKKCPPRRGEFSPLLSSRVAVWGTRGDAGGWGEMVRR